MLTLVNELKTYVYENDLYKKAVEYFWISFFNWKNGHPDEYQEKFFDISENEMEIFLHSVGLRSSEWPDCEYSHVTIFLKIHCNGCEIGEYIYWHSLSGDENDDDDFFLM